jgi:leucyl aminopeptidase (aminopeptidase T)
MIDKEKIKQPVVNMFKVNMGLKDGEKVLVVTDVPTMDDWRKKTTEQLADFVQRTLLAKAVSEIAAESFPGCPVEFYAYPSVGRHGTEPGAEVAEKLKTADVLIAITSYSLTHTKAREEATKAGVRVASMPLFLIDMFYPEGPMTADYTKVKEETEKLAKLVTDAREVVIKTPAGTDLKFSLKGRTGRVDAGIFTERGAWGNLPSGEAYVAPLEGTAEGRVVVEKGWYAGLTENMTLVFRDGEVVEVVGGGKVGDEYRELLKPGVDEEPYKSRRNFAELGIGTNPYAKRPDNVLEAEKIKGTVHVAVGDSSHMGGKVTSDLHQDFVLPKPDLYIDGKPIMKGGKII